MRLRKYLTPLECEEFAAGENCHLIELERAEHRIQVLYTKSTSHSELILFLRDAANQLEEMSHYEI